MNPSLLRTLVDKRIVRERTEIDANYLGGDIAGNPFVRTSGTFLITEITPTESGYVFGCASTVDGSRWMIPSASVTRIDGMCPTRLALNFNLTADGQPMVVGKRRGRKPKNRPLAAENA